MVCCQEVHSFYYFRRDTVILLSEAPKKILTYVSYMYYMVYIS